MSNECVATHAFVEYGWVRIPAGLLRTYTPVTQSVTVALVHSVHLNRSRI